MSMPNALRALLLFCLLATQSFAATPQVQNLLSARKTLFTENKGQVADQNGKPRSDVRYLYAAPGLRLALKANGFSYEVVRTERFASTSKDLAGLKDLRGLAGHPSKDSVVEHIHRVDIAFLSANAHPAILAEEAAEDYKNYYLAHTPEEGVTNVRSFAKLTYKNLYPNIDVVFYAKEEGELKYDFVLHPGARLSDIKMQYAGAQGMTAAGTALKVFTLSGEVQETIPASYYEGGEKFEVGYKLVGNTVGLAAQGVDRVNRKMVIDPNFIWGTYYGGSSNEESRSVALGSTGAVFIAGFTSSSSYIATSGTYQTTQAGSSKDIFIARFTSSGSRSWGTYYGGSSDESAWDLAVDVSGNILIAGESKSASGMATSGAFQTAGNTGDYDAILAKFTSSGARSWATYYGGVFTEAWNGVAADASGNVYVVGWTSGTSTLATSGAFQTGKSFGNDAMLAKFTSSGARSWCTYYGGSGSEADDLDLALDSSANIYFTGNTTSTSGIASSGAHQTVHGGNRDAFLAKFTSSGARSWATYFGGVGFDWGFGVAVDTSSGSVYITGAAQSSSGIASSGAYQTKQTGGFDAFLAKFTSSGVRSWSTYYGDISSELGYDVAVGPSGNVNLAGSTSSPTGLATSGAHQTSLGGTGSDAFLASFTSSGQLTWGTYYGGGYNDVILGVATDKWGKTYATGWTASGVDIASSGAYQTNSGGGYDAFLAKFEKPCFAPSASAGSASVCSGSTVSLKATGASRYRWYDQPSGGAPIDTHATFIKTLARSDTFYVAGYDGTCESARHAVVVTVHAKPSPALTGRASVCENTAHSYRAGKNTGSSYRWAVSGGTATGSSDTIKASWGGAGSGYLRLTEINAQGCSDSLLFPVAIHPNPTATWKAAHKGGRNYAFHAKDSTQADYFWQFGDGNTSNSGYSASHTYGKDSTYTVSLHVTSTAGCMAASYDTVNVRLTALSEGSAPASSLRLSPNPFRESATLSYSLTMAANVKIQLLDAQGRLIAQPVSGHQGAGEHTQVIDGEKMGLAPGAYLLKVLVDGAVMQQLIMKN